MTYGELIQSCVDICVDDQSTSYTGMTDTLTFIKREINTAISDIFALMKEYKLEPEPKTIDTVADQIYYPYPPGLMKPRSFTVDIGTINPELKIVQSQSEWNNLQQTSVTSGYPTRVFPRRDDFGIYPTPNDVYEVTIVGSYQPIRMTQSDYTTGVVTVTEGSTTVTGSGAFSEEMVGSWFCLTSGSGGIANGNWYRVAEHVTPQRIELSRTFTESSDQGRYFVIGQSPEIPEELHQYIPYKVGSLYHLIRRRDDVQAKRLENYFYTGDTTNAQRVGSMVGGVLLVLNDLKNKGRGSSNLIETSSGYRRDPLMDTVWGTTLTDSS